jgi:hypothetical protein
MKTLASQYPQFTPEERLRLTLAAAARGDRPEVQQLMRSCPEMTRIVPDPRFTRRVISMQIAVSALNRRWLEASALVIMHWMFVASIPAKDVTLAAQATATWKNWSAVWRGIESGLTKFCTEVDLTVDQVLGPDNGRSPVVEWARDVLDGAALADPDCENTIRQGLRQAWQGGNEP